MSPYMVIRALNAFRVLFVLKVSPEALRPTVVPFWDYLIGFYI